MRSLTAPPLSASASRVATTSTLDAKTLTEIRASGRPVSEERPATRPAGSTSSTEPSAAKVIDTLSMMTDEGGGGDGGGPVGLGGALGGGTVGLGGGGGACGSPSGMAGGGEGVGGEGKGLGSEGVGGAAGGSGSSGGGADGGLQKPQKALHLMRTLDARLVHLRRFVKHHASDLKFMQIASGGGVDGGGIGGPSARGARQTPQKAAQRFRVFSDFSQSSPASTFLLHHFSDFLLTHGGGSGGGAVGGDCGAGSSGGAAGGEGGGRGGRGSKLGGSDGGGGEGGGGGGSGG